MEELNNSDYHKVVTPLREVTINNLFARAVVENYVTGKVYVNDLQNPTTFYVVHPYGMTLLFGQHNDQQFNQALKEYALNKNNNRNTHEWMQAYPGDWDGILESLFLDCSVRSLENTGSQTKGIIELNTRVNFKFNVDKYLEQKKSDQNSRVKSQKTTKESFESMQGSVIPSNFWDNARDFLETGVGYSSYVDGTLACTAFSSYIMDEFLEIGIESIPRFRGLGLAQYTCSQLIDYGLDHEYEPVWSCRLENIGSYKLALKLGFEETLRLPYYRLSY